MPKEYKCTKCILYHNTNSCCIDGFGDLNSDILIVAESPTLDEDALNRIHYVKNHIKEIFGIYDISLDRCRVTNILRCTTKSHEVVNEDIWACRPYLVDEINSMSNLKIIVTLGTIAFHAISNKDMPKRKPQALGKYRGAIQFFDEFPAIAVLPTYALNSIARNPKFKDNIIEDIKRLDEYISGTYGIKHDVDYRCIYTIEELDTFIEEALKHDVIAFDTETTSIQYSPKERMLCLQFSWEEYASWYLPIHIEDGPNYWGGEWGYVKYKLESVLSNPNIQKIGHNIKYDIKVVEGLLDIIVINTTFDTMLAHFLINPDSKHDLKTLADMFTDMGKYDDALEEYIKLNTKTKEQKENFALHGYGIIPEELLKHYAMCDTDATMRLYNRFKPKIDESSYRDVLYGINMPATRVFADAERAGICVDKELMLQMQQEYGEKLESIQDFIDRAIFESKAEKWDFDVYTDMSDAIAHSDKHSSKILTARKTYIIEESIDNDTKLRVTSLIPSNCGSVEDTVYVISGSDHPDYVWSALNINSPKQLQELLFTKAPEGLGLLSKKMTPTGKASVNADSLIELANSSKNPILNMIVDFRSISTIKSTFIDGMLDAIDPVTGRIHPNYNMHIARTGRTSCNNPNMQNIPRDSEEGGKIRNIFVPEPGNVFVDGDIAQAEFRILGEYSKDTMMIQSFKDDMDIHRYIASIIYNVPEAEVSKDRRTYCKRVVFGTMYGMAPSSVAKMLGINMKEAVKIQELFFDLCPQAKAWLDQQPKDAKRDKCIRTLFGRIRYLYDVDSDDVNIQEATFRESKNSPIQSGASDYVMVAWISIYKEIKKRNLENTTLKITVHDSIIADTPKKYALLVKRIMMHYMARPIPQVQSVVMKAEVEIYDRWSGNKLKEEDLIAE